MLCIHEYHLAKNYHTEFIFEGKKLPLVCKIYIHRGLELPTVISSMKPRIEFEKIFHTFAEAKSVISAF